SGLWLSVQFDQGRGVCRAGLFSVLRRQMMMPDKPLILASSSPRRQYLMKETGFDFVVRKPDVDESFPDDMPSAEIARHLAQKKGHAMRDHASNAIVITADTVVILDDRIL